MPLFHTTQTYEHYYYGFPKLGLNYLAIPKTGSTSLLRELSRLEAGGTLEAGFDVHQPSYRSKMRSQVDSSPQVFSFTVVRDPAERMVSGFLDKVVSGKDFIYTANLGSEKFFPWYLKDLEDLCNHFELFLDWIQDKAYMDGHFASQAQLANGAPLQAIFDLKDKKVLINELQSRTDLSLNFIPENHSNLSAVPPFLLAKYAKRLSQLCHPDLEWLGPSEVLQTHIKEVDMQELENRAEFEVAAWAKTWGTRKGRVLIWGLKNGARF